MITISMKLWSNRMRSTMDSEKFVSERMLNGYVISYRERIYHTGI